MANRETFSRVAMLVVGMAAISLAQGPTSRPATTDAPGQQYPRLDAGLRATFRISAPGARQVILDLDGRHEMVEGDKGMWSITTEPLTPGFHYYWFDVDNVALTDPASESYVAMNRLVSGIEVPSKGEDFYDARDVPHGEVRVHSYVTKLTHQQRKVLVYTPPEYDNQPASRFPVLYLLHGDGEDRQAWWRQGHVNFIMDNLLAAGKTKPMIIVMEDASLAPGLDGSAGSVGAPRTDTKSTLKPAAAKDTDRLIDAQAIESVLINEVIPMVDATYRTVADREHRAMAGISIGGLQITMNHLDLFGYVGAFSPDLPEGIAADLSRDPAGFNQKVKLFFLGTGALDRENSPAIKNLHDALDKAGVKNVYYESTGTAHEWLTWRRDLYQFAPLLFQD